MSLPAARGLAVFEDSLVDKVCQHLLHTAAAGMGNAIRLRERMAFQFARPSAHVREYADALQDAPTMAPACEHPAVWHLDVYRDLVPIITIIEQGARPPDVCRLLGALCI